MFIANNSNARRVIDASPNARTETLNNESSLERRSLNNEDLESPDTLSVAEVESPLINPKSTKGSRQKDHIIIVPATGAEKESADAAE